VKVLDALADKALPWINDAALGKRVEPLRAAVVGGASGRVLEIGAGTGLNFALYSSGVEVTAIEPAEAMRRKAEARAKSADVTARIHLVEGRAKELPFDAGSIDTVVVTFTLCSIRNLDAAIGEIHRVLRPGGSLRILEHVKSRKPWVARLQRTLEPVWNVALAGCSLLRDPREALGRAGFDVRGLGDVELPIPIPVHDGITGAAVKA
jgi:SAM-dependent methyltransferase